MRTGGAASSPLREPDSFCQQKQLTHALAPQIWQVVLKQHLRATTTRVSYLLHKYDNFVTTCPFEHLLLPFHHRNSPSSLCTHTAVLNELQQPPSPNLGQRVNFQSQQKEHVSISLRCNVDRMATYINISSFHLCPHSKNHSRSTPYALHQHQRHSLCACGEGGCLE